MATRSVEGAFGVFKRGFTGIYRHCYEANFQRCLEEFTFRFNNRVKPGVDDWLRADRAMPGAKGKRLTDPGTASA